MAFSFPGDGLSSSLGQQFTTFDADHDAWTGGNCAVSNVGAWWYNACGETNPNGQYNDTAQGQGVLWIPWRGSNYSLKSIDMKMRPAC